MKPVYRCFCKVEEDDDNGYIEGTWFKGDNVK